MITSWLQSLNIPNLPDEWEVKQLLKKKHINVPEGFILKADTDILPEKVSFPVAVKICDPEILHKTDAGGVALNVTEETFIETVTSMRLHFPEKRLLVEKMSSYKGIEFILGGLIDPTFGPAIMIGAGGILTELYKDVTFRLVPLDRDEALRMLRELTISEVLEGYRGSIMDIHTLADCIVSVGDLITEMGNHFNQLDINPLVYSEGKWTALDGMLVLNKGINTPG